MFTGQGVQVFNSDPPSPDSDYFLTSHKLMVRSYVPLADARPILKKILPIPPNALIFLDYRNDFTSLVSCTFLPLTSFFEARLLWVHLQSSPSQSSLTF